MEKITHGTKCDGIILPADKLIKLRGPLNFQSVIDDQRKSNLSQYQKLLHHWKYIQRNRLSNPHLNYIQILHQNPLILRFHRVPVHQKRYKIKYIHL